ncbi:MAG: DUF6794 domain-containing protein [Bacteroidota bacterium]
MRIFIFLLLVLFARFETLSQVHNTLIIEGISVGNIQVGESIENVINQYGEGQRIKWNSYSYEMKYASKGISCWYLQSDSSKSVFAIMVHDNFVGKTSKGLQISDTLKVRDVTKVYGKGEWDGYDTDENGKAIIDCNYYDIGLTFTVDIGDDIDREDSRDLDKFYANNSIIEVSIEEGDGPDEDEPVKFLLRNLEDCFISLDTLLTDSARIEFKEFSKSELIGKTHFGLGIWMRNNWGLWTGSELSRFFNQCGIYHADDMSGIILTSYHRRLNGVPIRLNRQIKYYQNYWKKSEKEKKRIQRQDFKEFKVGDSVEFKYLYGFINQEQEDLYDEGSCYANGIILEKNNKQQTLLIELTESCGSGEILIEYQATYDQKVEKMKVGDQKWLYYSLWE